MFRSIRIASTAATYDATEGRSSNKTIDIFCPTAKTRYLFIYECCEYDNRNKIHSQPNNIFNFQFSFFLFQVNHIFSSFQHHLFDFDLCSIVHFILFSLNKIFSLQSVSRQLPIAVSQNLEQNKGERNRQGKEARAIEIYQNL